MNGKIVALIGVANKELDYDDYDVKNLTLLMGIGLKNVAHFEVEKKFADSEKRFRGTFDQASVGICYLSIEGKFLRVNQKTCDIIGYSRDELLEITFRDIMYPDDMRNNWSLPKKLEDSTLKNWSFEQRYLRKDGAIVWANVTVSLVTDIEGQHLYLVAAQDITDRKQAEEKLKVKHKLYCKLRWIIVKRVSLLRMLLMEKCDI